MKTTKIMSCMLLSGLGIGWLIGLSVSPVLYIVIAGSISLIAGVAGILSGLNHNGNVSWKVGKTDPLPITFLVIGLAVGASLGVVARTNAWLGNNPSDIIQKWEKNGLTKKEIAERLFDYLYPPLGLGLSIAEGTTGRTERHAALAGLFRLESDDCSFLIDRHGNDLRANLKLILDSDESSRFLDTLDSLSLEAFKEMICPRE